MSPETTAPRRLDPSRHAFSLTRRFSILSFICIGAVSVVSSILLSRFLSHSLLERDAQILMDVVQSIADAEDSSARFLSPDNDKREQSLERFVQQVAKLPDVLRANIYSTDQRMLWSSDPSLIGKVLGPNDELAEALKGEVTIESGVIGPDDPKPEHVLLHGDEPRFVENYLPVRAGGKGPVLGVVEVYRVPVALFGTIGDGLRWIWAIALGGGLFLYLTLIWIVMSADRLIRAQRDQLLESETLAVIGEMTGAIAHGIRNPLASIRTSAELLQDDPAPAVRESAHDITAQVDRLSEWVRQLLTYSREEPDRLESVPLTPLLETSLAGFEREMQRRGVTLDTALDPALPPVRGERVRLGHAINSLLSNALEAMPEGGRLRVVAAPGPDPKHVQVRIRDNGVGIPDEHLPRVFAPFFTSKRKGLGLGLPLVNRIVTRFGGAVSISSEPGQGTEVTVELPVYAA
jgi:two-component system, NtrC family, sensor histidine kinase HydH